MDYYIITPPGITPTLSSAMGILSSIMLFTSEDDAKEALKFMGLDNPAQHVITQVNVLT